MRPRLRVAAAPRRPPEAFLGDAALGAAVAAGKLERASLLRQNGARDDTASYKEGYDERRKRGGYWEA